MAFATSAVAASIVAPRVLTVEGTTVLDRDPRMDAPIAETERRLREAGEPTHVVTAVRAMYRRTGLDPTRRRPSSETLLRRIRRGESLPRINSAVDVGNWCSLETQLPYGLYDLDRITGAIELRIGTSGEEYPGIGKEVVHLGGRLTVADASGPFGNPSADSARTLVTTATTRLLVVIYAPCELAADIADGAAALTAERLSAFTGGEVGRLVTSSSRS